MNANGTLSPNSTEPIDPDDAAFNVTLSTDDGLRVVHVSGELDMSGRNLLLFACLACLAGRHTDIAVDMSKLTFLDCGGYGALVAVRRVLHEHGACLTVRNQTGQPARLLDMLARVEPAS